MADSLRARPARLVEFVPAVALAAVAAWTLQPWAALGLPPALALALLAAARTLGLAPDEPLGRRLGRRGVPLLAAILVYGALLAVLLAGPGSLLLGEPTPLGAALLSAGFIGAVLSPWRWWPVFGVLAGAADRDGASPDRRPLGPRRALALAREAARRGDPHFSTGLGVSLALVLLVGGALVPLAPAGLLDDATRRTLALGWAVLVVPAASLLVVLRTRRLFDRLGAVEPPAEPLALADDAVVEIPVDPRERDRELLQRCAAHEVDLALVLLRNGADPNARPDPLDRDQRTPAIIAATEPDLRLLRELILRGADLNLAIGGLTPLLAATRDSYDGRIESVQTLLTNGARVDVADADGDTPLHHAARTRDPIVAAMLLDAGADPSRVNGEGLTAVGVACRAGNEAVVRLLVERGAGRDPEGAIPALVALAEADEDLHELGRRLIRARWPVDATDRLGRTALHVAAANRHAALAQVLVSAGAAVDARAADGATPLIAAARAGATAVIAVLARAKADPHLVDAEGTDALMAAAGSTLADEATIEALLKLGADRTRRDQAGRTAVDRAVAAGRWPVVARLDPDYPLPSAIAEAELLGELESDGRDRAGLVTTALRHGRLDVAATLFGLSPPLPEHDRVAITTRLGDAPIEAIDWWLARVGGADFIARHGSRLMADALAADPPAVALADALVRSGASCAGGAFVARLLGAAPDAEAPSLESLALAWLERGADPFAAAPDGASLLHLAIRRGFPRLARVLLERGFDPNRPDAHGATPLFECIGHERSLAEPLVRELLAAGADPERAACDGRTPLGLSLAHGRHDLARWLDWSGRWRLPGRRLAPADLVAAAEAGDLAAVERLAALGLPVDARDGRGATALIRAAGRGHAAVVDWLLRVGADPSLAAPTGVDALTAAIAGRRDEVVAVLLAHGVAPDAPGAHGVPPLLVAAAVGARGCVERLLAAGAPPDATDPRGNTALHAAAQFAFTAPDAEAARTLLERLLAAGCPLDAANREGQTPLLLLLGAHAQPKTAQPAMQLARIADWFVAAGADVARQDHRGVGVLHACAIHGLTDAAETLRRAGAPIDARDRLNRTPADLALMLGYADLAAELGARRRN
jgi:ankyrin repeat protein